MAFAHNRRLEYVILSSENIEIESKAFIGCTSLKTFIFLGKTITGLDEETFKFCDGLKRIKVTKNYQGERTPIGGIEVKEDIEIGICGNDCQYVIDLELKKMWIIGTGRVDTLETTSEQGKQTVEEIIIEEGVTTFDPVVLKGFEQLKIIEIKQQSTIECVDGEIDGMPSIYGVKVQESYEENSFCGYPVTKAYGRLSETIEWLYDRENKLVLYGNGKMPYFDKANKKSPWKQFTNEITEVQIKEGVTEIGNYAFINLVNMRELTIAGSVTILSKNCFAGSSKLDVIEYQGTEVMRCGPNVFKDSSVYGVKVTTEYYTNEKDNGKRFCGIRTGDKHGTSGDVRWIVLEDTELIIYREGKMKEYTSQLLPEWNGLKESIVKVDIKKGVTSIGDYSLFGLENVEEVIIGDSVETIGTYSMSKMNSLTSISFPSSVTTIEANAFSSCSSLSSWSQSHSKI